MIPHMNMHKEVLARIATGRSYQQISDDLDLGSRNIVAGIAFRHRHPGVRKLGTGKRLPARPMQDRIASV